MSLPNTFVPGFHDEATIRKMQYCDFGKTGLKVSRLSLGTGGFSNLYGTFTLENCKQTVLQGLKAGINYIDTAPWYGQGVSETTLGKCLEGIPRQAYYIATKVGRYETDPKKMFDFSAERTRSSITESLKKLNVTYVDVLQIHDIEFAPSIDYVIEETLPVLLEAKNLGKAKFIGITGYPCSALSELLHRATENSIKIDMVLSYTRLSLFDQELLNYKEDFQDVAIVNAAVLGMGLLTQAGPQPWHPAHEAISEACENASHYCKLQDVDIAKLALKFAFDNPVGDTVLNGMNNPDLLKDTLNTLFEDLSEKEKTVLEKIQKEHFGKLKVRNWEGVEIANLKKALQE